jgi:TrmH family RNA methyltransferase
LLSSSNARLAAARRLTRRSARRAAGRFLAEGPQAVREALAAGAVVEVFATEDAVHRHPELTEAAAVITPKDAAALSETVTPQGIVAVCRMQLSGVEDILAAGPRLLAVLVEPNEPGNLGTIVRTADAAGADAVVICGGADPFNGKAVRASAGSVFHVPLAETSVPDLLARLRGAGIASVATAASAGTDLDALERSGVLEAATAWLFGSESRGLPADVIAAADHAACVPIYGRAESLNLAAAAAICLYASARVHARGSEHAQ